MTNKPLLIIAWGQRGRGDDAAGPVFLDGLRRALRVEQLARVDLVEAERLHAELALHLLGRERVLLVSADPGASPPYALQMVDPGHDASLSSPVLSAPALLAVCAAFHGRPAPPTLLLGLLASRFTPGRPLSNDAAEAMPAAVLWTLTWIDADTRSSPPPPRSRLER
jgi:hydrogenase maturation protease